VINLKKTVRLMINGDHYDLTIEPRKTLLEVLRDEIGLTGTKEACDFGSCGACTVLIDNRPMLSCLTLAVTCQGKEILTIEGLKQGQELHPLQEAFIEHGAIQCGYCTPGMVLSAKALLDQNPVPTENDIETALEGNICRCGGYLQIIRAVKGAAGKKSVARR
jgi:aerobic carbon-monoxide dehydrogenase small subunit